jgi:hypothetical protein
MIDCNQKFIETMGYSTEDLKEYSVLISGWRWTERFEEIGTVLLV